MFIRYYLDLAVPFEDVERALLDAPATWVPGMALDAEAGGQRLLAEVGFDVDASRRVDREVEIQIGEPYVIPSKTMLPIAWRATAAERIFPQLEADIEIAALGASRTQLSISARYRPPLGPVGRVLDKALLHRVAEATVKDFLDRVGERIAARVSHGAAD
ncbi:MAG TPA: hypothetical protein VJ259_00480 [Actinomycetota bacterium]|nr:hypothetical protein [Actinomycetota bacterium]